MPSLPDKDAVSRPAPEGAQGASGSGEVGARGPQYGGWARMDSDSVLRGWTRDRTDPARRLDVEIFIDGERTAILRADALDPKLVQLGEGDGQYAFSYLTPPRFRDGRPHSFQVRVRQGPYTLRCKQDSFELSAAGASPRLQVSAISLSGIRGWLHGGQYAKSIRLALWSDGVRIDPDLDTEWSGGGGALEFLAVPSGEILDRLCRQSLALAAPGMAEADYPLAVLPRLNLILRARYSEGGEIRVEFLGDTGAVNGEDLWFRITRGDEVQCPDIEALTIRQGVARFRLQPGLDPAGLEITAGFRSTLLNSLKAPLRPDCSGWVKNPGFRCWGADGVEAWTIARGAGRGFYEFPESRAKSLGLSGDVLRFDLAGAPEAGLLLSQVLGPHPHSAGLLPITAMVRSDRALDLGLVLTNSDGDRVGHAEVPTGSDWDWTLLTVDVQRLAAIDEVLTLSLTTSAEAGVLEVAGLTIGDSFEDLNPVSDLPALTGELAVNTDLRQWPHGIRREDLVGRSELARGWYGVNHRSESPMAVMALTAGDDEDEIALALAAPEVPEHLRLEVRLQREVLRLSRGMLDFEMGSPMAARRLFQSAEAGLPDHGEIDRIQIIRRHPALASRNAADGDEVLVTIARRQMINRSYHRFRMPFALEGSGGESAAPVDQADGEIFLVLEFRQPCAFAIRRLSVRAEEDSWPPAPAAYLALEDRNILAQVDTVRGLKDWISTSVQTPTPGRSGAETAGPWIWSLAPPDGIEVLVCGAEAIEAATDTLSSLRRASSVPHTVRLLAQSPDSVGICRLEAAVADQPWASWQDSGGLGSVAQLDGAIRSSSAGWVVVLAAGDVVSSGWLEALARLVIRDPQVALAGPLCNAAFLGLATPDRLQDLTLTPMALDADDSPARMARRLRGQPVTDVATVPILADVGLMIRRTLYLETGGLNHRAFQLPASALLDLTIRMSANGNDVKLATDAYVHRLPLDAAGTRGAILQADSAKLASFHPDSDIQVLLQQLRDQPWLAKIRQGLRAACSAEPAPGRKENRP